MIWKMAMFRSTQGEMVASAVVNVLASGVGRNTKD